MFLRSWETSNVSKAVNWSFKWPYHFSNLNSTLSLNNIMNISATYWPPNNPYRSTNCNNWQPNRSLNWKSPENFMRFPQKALEVLKILRNTSDVSSISVYSSCPLLQFKQTVITSALCSLPSAPLKPANCRPLSTYSLYSFQSLILTGCGSYERTSLHAWQQKRGKVSDARTNRAHGGGCQINFRQIIKRLMFYINKMLFYYTQKCELIIYCSR